MSIHNQDVVEYKAAILHELTHHDSFIDSTSSSSLKTKMYYDAASLVVAYLPHWAGDFRIPHHRRLQRVSDMVLAYDDCMEEMMEFAPVCECDVQKPDIYKSINDNPHHAMLIRIRHNRGLGVRMPLLMTQPYHDRGNQRHHHVVVGIQFHPAVIHSLFTCPATATFRSDKHTRNAVNAWHQILSDFRYHMVTSCRTFGMCASPVVGIINYPHHPHHYCLSTFKAMVSRFETIFHTNVILSGFQMPPMPFSDAHIPTYEWRNQFDTD